MTKKFNLNDILDYTKALETYGDLAGYEAITRALINERNGNRERALFWIYIYINIADESFFKSFGDEEE